MGGGGAQLEDNCVLYSKVQTLTDEQKSQALKNLLGTTPIGSFTTPIYWDGSSFKEAIIPGAISLEKASWEMIKQLADAGTIQNYFKVGDKKSFNLTDGSQHDAVILGFNQDYASDSSTKTGTVVTFAISGDFGTAKMYDVDPNDPTETYAWSDLYYACNGEYLNMIPSKLQNYLLEVEKNCEYYFDLRNQWTSRDVNVKLFPLSSYEISGYGARYGSERQENDRYQLFLEGKGISGWSSQWCRNNVSQYNSWFAYNAWPTDTTYYSSSPISERRVCLAFCI